MRRTQRIIDSTDVHSYGNSATVVDICISAVEATAFIEDSMSTFAIIEFGADRHEDHSQCACADMQSEAARLRSAIICRSVTVPGRV
jgi:hypothetical protein